MFANLLKCYASFKKRYKKSYSGSKNEHRMFLSTAVLPAITSGHVSSNSPTFCFYPNIVLMFSLIFCIKVSRDAPLSSKIYRYHGSLKRFEKIVPHVVFFNF